MYNTWIKRNFQFGMFPELEIHAKIEARGIGEIKQIRFYLDDKELQKRKARCNRSILDVRHGSPIGARP